MLNKFTLKFKDKELEDQYQNYQNQTHRLPMFKHISIFIFVAVSFIMVTMFINGEIMNQILSLGLFATTILLIIIVKKKPKFVRCALIIFNHLLIITSFEQDNECSPHYYYLRGITMMSAHMIIAMSGEFLDSMFSILSIFIVRMLLLFLQDKIFPYSTVLIAVLLPVYLIYSIYKTNEGFRSQFQLACIDSQWDNILTTLIDGAYLLMEFNPNQMTFNCKKNSKFQYTCNSLEDLKDFLRNNYIEKKEINLEKFFCEVLKTRDQVYILQKTINVRIQNKIVIVQYSIFFGHRPMVLLQICRCVQEGIIREEKYAKIESSYQSKYQKLLSLCVLRMKKIIQEKNDPKLIILFKQIFYNYLQESLLSQRRTGIHYYNLQSVFHIIKLIYRNKLLRTVCIPIPVQGNKLIVCKLLIDIIESQASHLYKISSKLLESGYEIVVECSFNENKHYILKKKIKPYLEYLKDIKYEETYIKLIFSNEVASTDLKPIKNDYQTLNF